MDLDKIREEVILKYRTSSDVWKYLNVVKELVMVQLLIEQMEESGAAKEELEDVLRYTVVVTKTTKHQLDWAKAYEDFHIDDYVEKYVK